MASFYCPSCDNTAFGMGFKEGKERNREWLICNTCGWKGITCDEEPYDEN